MAGDRTRTIAWSIDVSLLQPAVLASFLKIILLACGLLGGLLAYLSLVLGGRDMIGPLLALTAVGAGAISLLLAFVVIVFFRNRMTMSFVVDERGAQGVVIDRRARIGAKAAIAAGAVAGSPAVAGTGLLAETSADQGVSWRAVRSVACSPQRRTVTLANAWRTLLVLYCAADNYEAIADRATRAVAAQPRRPMFNPLPGFLARSALMIAAATPLFFLPRRLHVEAVVPLLALCFALAAVWLLPVFGWVVTGCVAVVGAQAAFNAIEHHRLPLSGDSLALTALAVGGAVLLVWLGLALVRGRYASALAGDMAEASLEITEPRRRS